ncbi:unnamed protein product [Rotaria sp. Silwood1]|nr:unnamed protein product [Rotaria sp. Silwood1]CAF1681999.1 unnamed protein product [Rotaria sp. Silwood1]CAF3839495.1 unnamed protein product [Rotaria sp. Silwood1]CAF3915460.1 unnamed protein product [Rotaria sp. Silwood1]CAF3929113.1 unnamed protein product [Rotaria sp. Silwood1]
MEVGAADGILSAVERRWIIGFANATGCPQVVLDQIQNYQPKDGFRAAGADGELYPKELEAIYALGKVLGAEEDQIKQLYELYTEEQ